jgi:hypothetical protein
MFIFRNRFLFYEEGLLAPHPTPKLEDRPLTFVRGCLFNVFAATLHSWRPSLYLQLMMMIITTIIIIIIIIIII